MTERREVGLHTIETTPVEGFFEAAVQAALATPGKPVSVMMPGPDPGVQFREQVNDMARQSHEIILAPTNHTPSVVEFARRVFVAVAQVRVFFKDPPTASDGVLRAMAAAADLADEWKSLEIETNLLKPVTRYRKTVNDGRRGVIKRHSSVKPELEKRDEEIALSIRKLLLRDGLDSAVVLERLVQKFGGDNNEHPLGRDTLRKRVSKIKKARLKRAGRKKGRARGRPGSIVG
jgi:hypothetical protein